MGRSTRGVIGMRFTDGDQLLGMYVVVEGADVLVATDGGYAKRTPSEQYPVQGRGGRGVLTARIVEARGELAGALMVHPEDEVFAITSAGGVIRTAAAEIKQSGRQTMGVRLVNLTGSTSLVAIARNAESMENGDGLDSDEADVSPESSVDPDGSGAALPGTTDAMTASVSLDGETADDDDESAGQGGLPADADDDQ
jgi:DNA gyrase subunit A